LGRHVVDQALAAGHRVTVSVRTPSRLPPDVRDRVCVHEGDLGVLPPVDLAKLVSGQDALINCAGRVTDGQAFVDIVEALVHAVESLPTASRPVCWFLAGAALLDIDGSGRRGVGLPRIKSTFWPHGVNFERIRRSGLDWRVLCPGPMTVEPALGLERLRIALDRLPVQIPSFARALPGPLILPVFAYSIPQMIVPYADAAALMLAHLARGDAMARRRVGLALPPGMRRRKSLWAGEKRAAA
jgi:putative NADH-flavin reductase